MPAEIGRLFTVGVSFNLLHPPGVQVSLNQGEGFLPFPNFYL